METLREAKLYVVRNWDKGVECPCCKQNVKVYKRKFNKSMAICLIELFRLTRGRTNEYLHIKEMQEKSKTFMLNMSGGNFATMKYWEVIDSYPNDDDSKRTSGLWRLTRLGRDFVMGRETIPSHVFTFNMKKLRRPVEGRTTIEESLDNPFNYRELIEE